MNSRRPQVGDVVEYEEDVVFTLRGGRTVVLPTVFVGTAVRVDELTVTLEVVDLDAEYPTMRRVDVPWASVR